MWRQIAVATAAASALGSTVDLSRTLSATGSDVIAVSVDAGATVRGVLAQGNADLAVVVRDPHEQPITRIDARERDEEPIVFRAATAGVHRLEVSGPARQRTAITYRLRLEMSAASTAADRDVEHATSLSTEARQAFRRGNRDGWQSSLTAWRTALPLWERLDDRPMVLATMSGIGEALYRLGEYEDARTVLADALALGQRLADRRATAELGNNLGMAALQLGDLAAGEQLLRDALAGFTGLADRRAEAITRANFGIINRQAGRYDVALREQRRALALHRSLGNRGSEAAALNNLALVFESLGRPNEAMRAFSDAIGIYHALGDNRAEGRVLLARGRLELAQRQTTRAELSTTRGLALVRTADDPRFEAEGIERLGQVLAAKGDLAGARAHYRTALGLFEGLNSLRGQSDALHDLGLAARAAGNATEAITHFDAALAFRRRMGARALEAETLAQRALARRDTEALDAAAEDAAAGIALAEDLRGGVFERELRTSFSASVHNYYAWYTDILLRLHRRSPAGGHSAKAFEIADRAKARGLVERIREGATGTAAPRAGLERDMTAIRARLDYLASQQWERGDDRGWPSEIATRVDALSSELSRLEAQRRRTDPLAHALWRPQEASIGRLRRLLDDETLIVAFMLDERRSAVWALSRRGLVVGRLPARRVLETRAQRLHALLSGTVPFDAAAMESTARELHSLLFGPIERSLTRPRIIVVPDGILHNLPFEQLFAAVDPSSPTARQVVSVPSATLLATVVDRARTRPPAPKPLVALGDPVFDANDPRVAAPRRGAATATRRLPFSRQEVEHAVASAGAGGVRVVDFDVTSDAFAGAALTDFRIVHVATHARRDDAHPELSGIVLSLVTKDGSPRSGFLSLREIYRMRLAADLVVLSACETGTGRLTGGEGLTTLAHGFFQAGATRVLASLWKVDDEATAAMMQRFYTRLLVGRVAPAVALRDAQRDLRSEPRWRHPRFWSGWVLQGAL